MKLKKALIILVFILAVSALAWIIYPRLLPSGTDDGINQKNITDEIQQVEISEVESFAAKQNGITKNQAEALCYEALGDMAEETGFPIFYNCTGAVLAKGKFYYVMNITWLVNGTHHSYIGNCFVSSDGCEIYDGIALSSEYEIADLRWKK